MDNLNIHLDGLNYIYECMGNNMEENILDILESIKDVYWDDHLDKIEKGVKNYHDAIAKNRRDSERHLNPILTNYWEVFHTHNIYRRKEGELSCRADNVDLLPCYDVGIFLVGYSSLPIVLSLAEIQPTEQIYFLYSRDTERSGILDQIAERISIMRPECNELIDLVRCSINHEIGNPSDPVTTFKQIKEVINNIADNKQVALDLTGGKKTMIGGGFTAGAILGFSESIERSTCDMYYVDSLQYDQRRGTPTPGTEFLSKLENPYDIYNVQSNLAAEKLFNNRNYEAAALLWEGVDEKLNSYAKRYGLEEERKVVEKSLYMADCYSLWDAFDYIDAWNSKNDNGDLWDYSAQHTCDSIDVLGIMREVVDPQTLFNEEKRIIHYAVDRYQNGTRRMDSDRFEDAIVRFTQVVEILCRYRIYQIATSGKLTDNSRRTVSQEDCLDESWSISKLIIFLFGQSWRYDDYYQIEDESIKLKIKDYGYKDATEITALIDTRNKFVHVKSNPGLEEMANSARNLGDLALKFLVNFSVKYRSDNCLSFDDLLELHRFRSVT